MKKRYLMRAVALALALSWLLGGCGESREPFAGTYRSVEPYAGKGHIELILKANGEATWAFEGKTTKFKWRVDENRLWFYTKDGGIIHVTATEGGKKLTADMSGEWHASCPTKHCVLFERVTGGGS